MHCIHFCEYHSLHFQALEVNEPVLSPSQPVSLRFYKRDDASDPNASFSLINADDAAKRCGSTSLKDQISRHTPNIGLFFCIFDIDSAETIDSLVTCFVARYNCL